MWLCDNFIISRYDGVTKCAIDISHVKYRYEDADKNCSVCDKNKASCHICKCREVFFFTICAWAHKLNWNLSVTCNTKGLNIVIT